MSFSALSVPWYSPNSVPKVASLAPVICQLFAIPQWSLARDQKIVWASCRLIVSADTPITVVGCGNPEVWSMGVQGTLQECCPMAQSSAYHCSHLCLCIRDYYITTSSMTWWQQTHVILILDNSTNTPTLDLKDGKIVDTLLYCCMILVLVNHIGG